MGTLSIVATPIGNLEDMTFRAVRTLMETDVVLCEDTRVAHKLLSHFNIRKPLISFFAHNQSRRIEEVIALLRSRKNVALITDAGTPTISDPGAMLVDAVWRALGASVKIEPIPGASAIVAALSVAGFPADAFSFFGFPPSKNKRNKFFAAVAQREETAVFYESPHRIEKSLRELAKAFAKTPTRPVALCKELTKQFEYIFRGTVEEVLKQLSEVKIKGEFVVVVGPKKHE